MARLNAPRSNKGRFGKGKSKETATSMAAPKKPTQATVTQEHNALSLSKVDQSNKAIDVSGADNGNIKGGAKAREMKGATTRSAEHAPTRTSGTDTSNVASTRPTLFAKSRRQSSRHAAPKTSTTMTNDSAVTERQNIPQTVNRTEGEAQARMRLLLDSLDYDALLDYGEP